MLLLVRFPLKGLCSTRKNVPFNAASRRGLGLKGAGNLFLISWLDRSKEKGIYIYIYRLEDTLCVHLPKAQPAQSIARGGGINTTDRAP